MADYAPTIVLDTQVVIDPNAVANEQQKIIVTAEGGTFTLTFGGKTTGNIKFNATPAEVVAALNALATISAGDVKVSGGPGDSTGSKPYLISFTGGLEDQDVSQVEATGTNLTATGTHTAVASTVAAGAGPTGTVIRALPPQGDATERVQPRAGISPKADRAAHASTYGD